MATAPVDSIVESVCRNASMDRISKASFNNMGAKLRTDQHFDLFGLPPELRDKIYDDLLVETVTLSDHVHEPEVYVTGAPKLELLLLSRQFSSEYQCASRRNATIIVADRLDDYNGRLKSIPCAFAPKLHVEVLITDNSGGHGGGHANDELCSEVSFHEQKLTDYISSCSKLRDFSLICRIHPILCSQLSEDEIMEGLLPLTTIPQLDVLEVALLGEEHLDTWEDVAYDEPFEPALRWTAQDPFMRKVQDRSCFRSLIIDLRERLLTDSDPKTSSGESGASSKCGEVLESSEDHGKEVEDEYEDSLDGDVVPPSADIAAVSNPRSRVVANPLRGDMQDVQDQTP